MTFSRRWMTSYAVTLVVAFAALFLLTRSSILPGDAVRYINVATSGDIAEFHYGNPSHFLQIPLSRVIWLVSTSVGLPVSVMSAVLALALAGTLAAIVFIGLIAADLTGQRWAAWFAAILFGTSLHVWTQVNGEQYGLALGFLTAAIWCALNGRPWWTAGLFALAMTAHAEFFLAGPVVLLAMWKSPITRGLSQREKITTVAATLAGAAVVATAVVTTGTWAMGKWTTPATFVSFISHIFSVDHAYTVARPEPFRALKGLMTALTAGGHVWRDVLTGRGAMADPTFLILATVALVVLLTTVWCVISARANRPLFLIGLVWLLPFHVLGNWWFESTVEKYHGGALAALVLLVTGGLVHVVSQYSSRQGVVWCATYLSLAALLNLTGAVWPMRVRGEERAWAEQQLRQLAAADQGRAVFIACDAYPALVAAGVPYFRIRSFWNGPVAVVQETIRSWADARVAEGRRPYLVGRWCLPEEWITRWSQAPFDLAYLATSFVLTPTNIVNIPLSETVATNPNSWKQGDVIRLDPRSVSQ